ncbi:hypothetical protein Ddye_013923 [Dipteronia dyeriana]|uniref:Reverse transcriptase domain-containing protein n=1 Tax=Dipteronia dyeriana TaxID=168575 RepID=A0AAD9X7A2_9ROSI|nr:hypothetical protein Ddye_013923 [Dipteronia dyeriana]
MVGGRPKLEGFEFSQIFEDSRRLLEESFSVEEVREALNGCDGNKAPANEVLSSWRSDKEGGIVLKLEFEKTYDSVDHKFLDSCLEGMGFGERWRGWMSSCISSPMISMLVNGSPLKEFAIDRGLRQGDHLSPFLFNITVEALNRLLLKARDLNLLKGKVFGRNMTHLEESVWFRFLSKLDKFRMRKSNPDSLIWTLTPSGNFSVSSYRRELECRLANNSMVVANLLLWSEVVPPKVDLFMWMLAKQRALVGELLSKFTGGSIGSQLCPFCMKTV